MQSLRILPILLLFFSQILNAQFIVSGSVKDSASGEPLYAASVFCQNTTIGTTTNKQGEYSLNLKSGGYDLIFSYTGYQTQTIRVSENNNKVDVILVKQDKSMAEVVLKNSYEVTDGWTKYGDFFTKNFIGTTPNADNTVIDNPDVLKFYFYKRTNRLKVMASEPIKITNHALGYTLNYQLDSFVYYYNTDLNLYRGYCLYAELDGNDSLKKVWAVARKKAYEGSKLQFMRSYYDSTLKEDGWIIDMLEENDDKKFSKVDPYDTTYYGALDSTMQIEIWYPRKISVTYTKKRPENEYIRKMNLPRSVPYIISYIDFKDAIAIMQNGYYYDQKDWINQGYWSWKNLADILPYDYSPPE
jgi:hypothetical protein